MMFLVLLSALLACAAGVPLEPEKPRLDGRIVGGSTTTIENHPWMVSVQRSNSYICGGVIIHANWIVTGVHCVDGTLAATFVRSGSTYSNSGGTIHSVTRKIVHPKYNSRTQDFDVALVEVSPAFIFSSVAQPITLEGNEVDVGTNVVVTGWGRTSEGGPFSTTLREVNVKIVSDASCHTAFAAYGGITLRMICAAVPGGGKDACQGDSGGPLVANNMLVGIVSWGLGCARAEYPGVYTKVSVVRDWILNSAV